MIGDEETLMNRRKTKKQKLAEYRMSTMFGFLVEQRRSRGHAGLYSEVVLTFTGVPILWFQALVTC